MAIKKTKLDKTAGERLKKIRLILNMSQNDLCDEEKWIKSVGIMDQTTISDWENYGIPEKKIRTIAKYFNIPSYLLTDTKFDNEIFGTTYEKIYERTEKNLKADISDLLPKPDLISANEIKDDIVEIKQAIVPLSIEILKKIMDKNSDEQFINMHMLSKAKDKRESDAFTYTFVGNIWKEKERYDEALKSYNKAIDLDKDYTDAYFERSLCFFDLKDFENSLADSNKVIELNPNNQFAYLNRGFCSFLLNNFENALADFTKCIKLNPNDFKGYMFRGMYFFEIKNFENALADFKKCIEFDNDKLVYLYRELYFLLIGFCLLILEDYNKALINFNEYIKLNPNNEIVYRFISLCYIKLENYSDAITNLNKYIKLNQNNKIIYYMRGNCFFKLGDLDNALADKERFERFMMDE